MHLYRFFYRFPVYQNSSILKIPGEHVKHRALLLTATIYYGILTAAPLVALDTESIPIEKRAAWIVPATLDPSAQIDHSLVDCGFYYILNDQQKSVSPHARYFHGAYRVINNSGLEEASKIEITYSPAYESLSLHGIRVYRDGATIDYRARVRWKEIQREPGLDNGLYDEDRTMLLVLEDIRKDDVIEYDYSINGSNPILGNRYYEVFSYGLDYPMAVTHFRLVVPKGREVRIKQHLRELPVTERPTGDGGKELVWEEKDSPAIKTDERTPLWFESYPWIEIGEWDSWESVRSWGRSVFPDREKSAKALARTYAEILAKAGYPEGSKPSAEDSLLAVLRFVQDEIRYFGIEIGANSHRPRNPQEVVATRFGDCKDKAALFCALASLAGWEAYPALVNSDQGEKLGEWLPSPRAFDHVIAAVRGPNGLMWFDPTISYQGGKIGSIWAPDYGTAMILSDDGAALARMPPQGEEAVEVHETYSSDGYDNPGTLEVVSTFRGYEADKMRFKIANTGRSSIEKDYLEFYQHSFPKAEKKEDIATEDDREENVLVMRESYSIPELWSKKEGETQPKLYVYPYTFSGYFSGVGNMGSSRKAPLALKYPWKASHRITVRLPEDLKVEESEYASDNPWYRLKYTATKNGLDFELRYDYEPTSETVAANDFPTFRKRLETDSDDYLGYTLTGGKEEEAAKAPHESEMPLSVAFALIVTAAAAAYGFGLARGKKTAKQDW